MSGLHALARMNTATTGTGSVITLSTAVSGFLTFALAKVADGEEVSYGIRDGSNSEVGRGVVGGTGTTLTRSVVASTNSNNPISLSGTAQVFITALAEDFSRVAAPNKPGVTMTKHGNLAQLVCAPNDFNLRDLPPAVQYDGDVVISRGGLVFTSVTSNINARIGPLTFSTLGSERVRIDTAGNVGIGTTSPAAQLDVTSITSAATRGVTSSQFTADVASAFFLGRKARGTPAAPSIIVSGDYVAGFAPAGYDGAAFQQGGFIGFQSSGTIAAGSVPMDFIVFTGTSGNGTERLRITATGAATFTGAVTISSATASTTTTTGALVVSGGAGIAGAINGGGALTVSGLVTFSNTTVSTTTATGALVISGGLGVAGAINGGGALTVSGLVTASNTTNATNTATGAIQTSGGLGVVKDIWCGGELNVTGTAWPSWTPTISGLSSLSAATVQSATYKQIGKIVHWQMRVSCTSNATAFKQFTFTPPVTAVGTSGTDKYAGSGRIDIASAPNGYVTCHVTGATGTAQSSDLTTTGSVQTWLLSGCYPAA